MKQVTTVLVVLSLCMIPAFAQEWSSEQKEAWDFIVKETNLWCAGNASYETVHPNSIYWGSLDPAPFNRASDQKFYEAYRRLGGKCHVVDAFPLTIVVEDGFAFVMYFVRQWSQAPGEDKPSFGAVRWLDVLKKENGKWLWFTGYGDFE